MFHQWDRRNASRAFQGPYIWSSPICMLRTMKFELCFENLALEWRVYMDSPRKSFSAVSPLNESDQLQPHLETLALSLKLMVQQCKMQAPYCRRGFCRRFKGKPGRPSNLTTGSGSHEQLLSGWCAEQWNWRQMGLGDLRECGMSARKTTRQRLERASDKAMSCS